MRSVPALLAATILVFLLTSCSGEEKRSADAQIAARIHVPGRPFSAAAGSGLLWVVSRSFSPHGCSNALPCSVIRIDPRSNHVVGRPIPVPAEPWSITVGGGFVWVTQFDGSLIKIDARTGRIVARVTAHPVYFGSVLAYGGGYLWTGNDDERYAGGSTVTRLDPSTDRVVGRPIRLGSPQSVAFGAGAFWVADHTGALVKLDPKSGKVLARTRLAFGPHGIVATEHAVFVADSHGARLLEADPATARIRRITRLPVGAIYPAIGGGSLWSGAATIWGGPPQAHDDRVLRIDERSMRVVQTIHVGGDVPNVAFGFGSAWAVSPRLHQVIRITQ